MPSVPQVQQDSPEPPLQRKTRRFGGGGGNVSLGTSAARGNPATGQPNGAPTAAGGRKKSKRRH